MRTLKFYAAVGAMSLAAGTVGMAVAGCSGGSGDATGVIAYEYDAADPGAAIGDVISSITILPMETSERSLISSEEQLFVHGGEYYFVDKRNRYIVSRFDAEGRFLNTIGSPGRADNEYNAISDAFPVDGNIGIYSYMNNAVYSYSPDGKFIAKKPFGSKPGHIAPARGGGYWGYMGYNNGEMPERVIKTDDTGAVVGKFMPSEAKILSMAESIAIFISDGEDVLVRESFSDRIYSIDSQGGVDEKYVFDFGRYAIPASYFESSDPAESVTLFSSDFASFHSFFESRRHSVLQVLFQFGSQPRESRSSAAVTGFRSGDRWRWVKSGTETSQTILSLSPRALVDDDTLVLLVDNYKIREFIEQNPGLVRNPDALDRLNLEGLTDDAANPSLLLCRLR
jgi:hypothetical protein